MATAVIEPEGRVEEVHIEGLALMKIMKHCHDSLPNMVSGSMLGLASNNGILEITHAFPNPDSHKQSKEDDIVLMDEDYQIEMMRLLKEVNVDNNCVGWYQSMYLGIYSTPTILETQYVYQTDLSPNAVVLLYDPIQTTKGTFCLKAYRLSDECLEIRNNGSNCFIKPSKIFEELPLKCTNPSFTKALLLQDYTAPPQKTSDLDLDRLDMSTQPYLEKHLELLCGWVDELSNEQQKFQYYSRHLNRGGKNVNKAVGWNAPEAPRRMESLLLQNQIDDYCQNMDKFVEGGLGKLFLAGGLHKEERATITDKKE